MASMPSEPFHEIQAVTRLGTDFMAFGFPSAMDGGVPNVPAPRLFKGHFQRFIRDHDALSGTRYLAGELSIPCPAGFSGGPIFDAHDYSTVLAMATGNVETQSYIDSFEDTATDGVPTRRVEYRKVISYGIALMLDDVSDWLEDLCPARNSYENSASLTLATDETTGK